MAVSAATTAAFPGTIIQCDVYPAMPPAFSGSARHGCGVVTNETSLVLHNGFMAVEISRKSALISSIENKLTGERLPIERDQAGFTFAAPDGLRVEWLAGRSSGHRFSMYIKSNPEECVALLSTDPGSGATKVTFVYSLKQGQFWVERRLSVTGGDMRFDRLVYGGAEVPGGSVKELKLGKFDTPRLISSGAGGVFAGVGWWFYEVRDGLYQNTGMDYQAAGRFEAEPWYLGVFKPEPGEPYPGWFWYKTFLSERKLAYDKQRSYALWNARSGYSFLPISNPDLLNFVGTAEKVGLDGITTGEVRGLVKGTHLAATNRTARRIIDAFAAKGVSFGVHEGDVQPPDWATDSALKKKLEAIDSARAQGIRNLTVDFFRVTDRFADHRRVAAYFRHIRDRMDYTECHLGMAAYGPQFQREVLINHPTDLKGFDIARFSSDWATLAGFRHSRREWQQRYEYLMPENGLFYFCTHYSNYPRSYLDPEPQQFLYVADAWRGLAYAFHDKFGSRNSVAAQAAFSTFYVFGFLDARIPHADAEFARAWLAWVKTNADILNRGRVCYETDDALVMSKTQDGRGAIFVLNYTPGRKRFELKMGHVGNAAPARIQKVYPFRGKPFHLPKDGILPIEVSGENLAVFQINDAFKGLPPENQSIPALEIIDWKPAENGLVASFFMPDISFQLKYNKDSSLPERVVSADQVETEFVTTKNSGKSLGKLPREFLDAYGFEEDKYLPTWKAAPWAFADRVWLVYLPERAPAIVEPKPVVRFNGSDLPLHPRVRYNPGTRLRNPEKWDVPMFFADITGQCRFGEKNQLIFKHGETGSPGTWFIAGFPEANAR
jgi:hypothetical protein